MLAIVFYLLDILFKRKDQSFFYVKVKVNEDIKDQSFLQVKAKEDKEMKKMKKMMKKMKKLENF